jgi:hypothetical protein
MISNQNYFLINPIAFLYFIKFTHLTNIIKFKYLLVAKIENIIKIKIRILFSLLEIFIKFK